MEIRRKDKRFREENEVIIQYALDRRKFNTFIEVNAVTYDLSISGARLRTTKSFPLGATLRIQINLTRSKQVVKVDGKVKWLKKMTDEDSYEIGVEFLHDISKTILSLLRHLYGEDVQIPSVVS